MSRIDQIRRMLESNPQDIFLNFSLAMEYQSAGQLDDALQQYDKTIEFDPQYLAAHVRKGKILLAEKRYDEARNALQLSLSIAQEAGDSHSEGTIRELISQIS